MKTTLTIKNFRIFDSEGSTFDINPITILTGCNNSGKSSLVKACALFADWIKSTYENVKQDGYLAHMFRTPLRVTLDYLKLGQINSVLNNKNREITLQFTYSNLSLEDITVTYVFTKNDKDIANNAWLSSINITNERGDVLLETNRDWSFKFNVRPIKQWVCDLYQYNYILRQNNDPRISALMNQVLEKLGKSTEDYIKQKEDENSRFLQHLEDRYGPLYKDKFSKIKDSSIFRYILPTFGEDKPLLFFQFLSKFSELDQIPKNELLNHIHDKVKTGEYYPSPHAEGAQKEDFLNQINLIVDEYTKSCYSTFSDFLGAIENTNGLVFDSLALNPLYIRQLVSKDKYLYNIARLFNGTLILDDLDLSLFFKSIVFPFFIEAVVPKDLIRFNYLGTTQIVLSRVFPINTMRGTFTTILNDYISATAIPVNSDFKRGFFIDKWIKRFSIGSSVLFKLTEEGSGVSVMVTDSSSKTTNICDMGHGIAQLLSILISIETSIFKYRSYIPEEYQTISIEEPEAHLHPRYQSLLVPMIIEAYKTYGVHFIIETHSEYLIRAIQKHIAYGPEYNEYGLANKDVSIFYFNEPRKGQNSSSEPQIRKIEIAEDGCLVNPFGPGFFDEALNLSTDLLRIKLEKHEK